MRHVQEAEETMRQTATQLLEMHVVRVNPPYRVPASKPILISSSVLRECKYGDNPPLQVTPGYTKQGYEAALTQPHLLLSCPDIDYHLVHSAFIHRGISDLHVATVDYVLKCLPSTGESIERLVAEYLSTIGSWFPMISRRLNQSLKDISSKPRADFASLMLSIYLVLQPPFHQYEASIARSPLYYKTKQLFSLLQSAEFMSIEMVQSALLITVYEYGHGFFHSAFLSVGTCARMAHALGWHKKRGPLMSQLWRKKDVCGGESVCSTGIQFSSNDHSSPFLYIPYFLVSHRRISLSSYRLLDLEPDFSPTALSPFPNMDLPTEDEDWDLPPDSIGSGNVLPQTAFLQAQGTQWLGRVISLVSNPSLNIEDRRQEDSNLKISLVQFAISVTNCSRDVWGANCGTLGLTYR